jgi:hypothetical protein
MSTWLITSFGLPVVMTTGRRMVSVLLRHPGLVVAATAVGTALLALTALLLSARLRRPPPPTSSS